MINQTIHVLLVEDHAADVCRFRKLVNEVSSVCLTWKTVDRLSTAQTLLCTELFNLRNRAELVAFALQRGILNKGEYM
jgi:hypothetical protein